VVLVRTYWFPGSFNEANPESSARYTETNTLHVEADSPPGQHLESSEGLPLRTIPNRQTDGVTAASMATLNEPSEDP